MADKRQRQKIRKDEDPIPTAPSGRPPHKIRCWRCYRLLATCEFLGQYKGVHIECRHCKVKTSV